VVAQKIRCAPGGAIYKHPSGFNPVLQARPAILWKIGLQRLIQPLSAVAFAYFQSHFQGFPHYAVGEGERAEIPLFL
jgi:hypothetical protein